MLQPGKEAPAFLHDRALNRILEESRPLVFIAAPPGFGKSRLSDQLVAHHERAGRTIYRLAGRAWAEEVGRPTPSRGGITIVEDALILGEEELMAAIAEIPVDKNRRYIFVSRTLPAIEWSKLEADGRATVVRAEDLRVTLDEARHFADPAVGRHDLQELRQLHSYSGGCAAALEAMTKVLLAKDRRNSGVAQKATLGLARALKADLPRDLVAFLAESASLEVLSHELVESVLGSGGAADFLRCRDEFMLLVPSPYGGDFLQVLPFVRDCFREEHPITSDRRLTLLASASAWLRAEGMADLAIIHLLEAKLPAEALAILETDGPRLLTQNGDNPRMLAWLEQVVALGGVLTPKLRLWRVWALAYSLRLDQADEALLATLPVLEPKQLGDIAFAERLRISILARRGKIDEVERLGEAWMERWSERETAQAAGVALLLALVHAYKCNPRAERRLLLLSRQYAVQSGNDAASLWVLGVEALTELHAGRAIFAADIIDRAQAVAARLGGTASPISKMLSVIAAQVQLELDNIDLAGNLLDHGYEETRSYGLVETHLAAQEAMVGYTEQTRGANEALINAHQQGISGSRYMLAGHLHSIGVLLRAGRTGEARARFDAVRDAFADELDAHGLRELHSTEALLLYGEGDATGALDLVRPLLAFADANGQRRRFTSLLLLRAAAKWALGDARSARQCFSRAIGIASSGQLVRTVLAMGWAIQGLLVHMTHRDEEQEVSPEADKFLHRICDRLGVGVADDTMALAADASLTPRERELLKLMDSGLRTGEIAQRLGIGISTAKWHLQSVFRKLGVRNRSGAVAVGRRLGLSG